MTFEIYSFAHTSLPIEIAKLQSEVFKKFGYKINQLINDKTHSENLEIIIKDCKVDYLILFDVDCVPLKKHVFDCINLDIQNYDLVGAIGCANHLNKEDIYVHPSFMFFKPQLYFECGSPVLKEDCNNDVAQNFTRACIKNKKTIKYWNVTSSDDHIWSLPNNTLFGHGCIYENKIYHQFEIRKNNQHNFFINKCNEILNDEL